MVREAAAAGAGLIKFQTYKAERLATRTSVAYWDRSAEPTESQFQLFSKYDRFDEPEYRRLAEECERAGIGFSTSPFDVESVEWLDELVEVFKIASGDITNMPLLAAVAATRKPVLLSTGAATVGEIEEALDHLDGHGAGEVAVLHCTLAYPTPLEDANVAAIAHLASVFPGRVLGYSDHTAPPASFLAIAAAYAVGARVIETHFTLDRSLPGNDHYHALDPGDLARLVRELDEVRQLLGRPEKRVRDVELSARTGARRSVVARVDIAAGTPLSADLLDVKRPGGGVPPSFLDEIDGWAAAVDIPEDTTIEWHMLHPGGYPRG
jgi:N-acetylneuraminate synthase